MLITKELHTTRLMTQEQEQVKDLMAKAFATLDALSNFHFTPKVLLLFPALSFSSLFLSSLELSDA